MAGAAHVTAIGENHPAHQPSRRQWNHQNEKMMTAARENVYQCRKWPIEINLTSRYFTYGWNHKWRRNQSRCCVHFHHRNLILGWSYDNRLHDNRENREESASRPGISTSRNRNRKSRNHQSSKWNVHRNENHRENGLEMFHHQSSASAKSSKKSRHQSIINLRRRNHLWPAAKYFIIGISWRKPRKPFGFAHQCLSMLKISPSAKLAEIIINRHGFIRENQYIIFGAEKASSMA